MNDNRGHVVITSMEGTELYITREANASYVKLKRCTRSGEIAGSDQFTPDQADVMALRFQQMAKLARGKK